MGDTATLDSAITTAVDGVRPLSRLKAEPDWLRADVLAPPVGVDRARGIIFGRVLAEKGPFKSAGRGEFDDESLDKIVELANAQPNGLKSRFTHPGLSADGLGKFLGRDRNVRRDGDKVRGDLHLDRTALEPPPDGGKPLGVYVMDLAESDPGALGSSLVLKTEKLHRLDSNSKPLKDAKGDDLPPLWRPTKLHAIDVVDDGDAVHGSFLGTELPDQVVRDVSAALDAQFTGCDRATIHARGAAFLDRYLDLKFGDDDMATDTEPTSAAPKPAPAPKPPAPTPTPAPTPAPRPAGPTGELSAEIEAMRDDLKRLHMQNMAAVLEQREAIRTQARADDALACLRQAEAMRERGTVTVAALSDADPGFVPLGTFLHLLDNADAVARETLKGKESPVTLRAAFLKLLPTLRPQAAGERIQQGGEGQVLPLSADRRRELLAHTPAGRAVLKDEAARN